MRVALAALAFLMCIAATAQARQVALVVGVARYDGLPSLKNPQRDAAAIADRLRDQGFEVIEAFDADRFGLERVRRRFLAEARGADLALFYFAGHGIQLFDRNVLLARDAEPSMATSIGDLGIDLNGFMAELRAAGPVRTAFLIDACRDNPLGFDETVALLRRLEPAVAGSAAGSSRSAASSRAPARGLSSIVLPSRGGAGETLAFFAAQPGRVSFDGEGRNSFYVEGLLEALAKPGRPLTEILREASAFVRTVTNGEQVPQLVSDWTGDLVLGRASSAKVRYLNAYKAGGNSLEPMSEADAKFVGDAARAIPALGGTFIVRASQSFTESYLDASETERSRAKALGTVNGFAIDYDIDRDGRDETIGVYFRQTNVVMDVVDEGVSLQDTPCWDFESDEVITTELALRDINGDRRPEVMLHLKTEAGGWGRFCILEYIGSQRLAATRRGSQTRTFAESSVFRVLLRIDAAETVNLGADGSIEACGGSNCHTRTAYVYDGSHFRMTLDESEAPTPARAKPFRDHAEHLVNQKADAPRSGPKGAQVAEAALPKLPDASAAGAGGASDAVARWIAEVYLQSGAEGNVARLAYEPEVAYYGKTTPRATVLADKRRYFARWPRRSYRLLTETVQVSAAAGGSKDVLFAYTYEVSDGKRTTAGRGVTRLTLRATASGYVIGREEGEVVRRP